jgi:hypothetical protein
MYMNIHINICINVGVRDFFYEPAHALINSPTEIRKIGKGVFLGAMSLVGHSADGFIGIILSFSLCSALYVVYSFS